jgi:hypothetical protein
MVASSFLLWQRKEPQPKADELNESSRRPLAQKKSVEIVTHLVDGPPRLP